MTEHKIEREMLHEISRRAFLLTAGKTAAGVAAAGVVAGALAPDAVFAETKKKAEFEYTFNDPPADALPHPMQYQKLDPDEAKERAYKAYQEKGG